MFSEVLEFLPLNIAGVIKEERDWNCSELIEIRLRVNQPLQLITYYKDVFPLNLENQFIKVTERDIETAFLLLTRNSVYAIERQLKEGFITVPGGHRVGFTGQAVLEKGKISLIKDINSLNYRITHEIIGSGEKIVEKIYNQESDCLYNTLIISPPLCGKTTLLRDLLRIISNGFQKYGLRGRKTALVDERSEIAGAYNGVPQNMIGSRTDLLDNCPKAEGIMLLLRSMSPEVIVVDEIGREEDIVAIREVINSGVNLLATVHGRDFQSLFQRPSIKKLLLEKVFERYIVLSKRKGIGTLEKILDVDGKEVI